MSRKQDWTPRPKILGWIVVNLAHPDVLEHEDAAAGGELGLPAAVVANESGWVYHDQESAEAVAEDLRREHENNQIVAAPVLAPGEDLGPRKTRQR